MIVRALFAVWTVVVLVNALSEPLNLEHVTRYFFSPHMAYLSLAGSIGAVIRATSGFAGLAFMALCALGAGGPVASLLNGRARDQLGWHLAWLGGLAACSLFLLGLGFTGLLRPAILIAGFSAAALGGIVMVARKIRGPAAGARLPRARGPFERALSLMALAGAAAALLCALAPQAWQDALVYYYAAPKKALDLGHYITDTATRTDGFPHSFELLFIPAMLVGKETLAKLVTWQELALCALALAGLMRAAGATGAGVILAQALFWTLPFTGQLASVSYSDCAAMHAGTVGLWFLKARRGNHAAFAVGWLMALKYSTIIVAAPLIVGAFLTVRRISVWPLLLATAPLAPWLVRNFYGHGQPFYPLMGELFATFETENYLIPFGIMGPVVHPEGGTAAPLAFLVPLWDSFTGKDVTGMSSFSVLWLLPAAALVSGKRGVLMVAAASVLWLVVGRGVLRYYEPVVPWILAAGVLAAQRRGWLVPTVLAGMILSTVQLAHNFAHGYRQVNPVPVAIGAETPRGYLRRVIPPPPVYMDIAGESGDRFRHGTTYVMGDLKAYYWEGSFLLDSLAIRPHLARWLDSSVSPERLYVKFRQRNIRHLAYNLGWMQAHHEVSPRAFAWTRGKLDLYQRFWRASMRYVGERVSEESGTYVFFFDVVRKSDHSWPDRPYPFALPGTEPMVVPGDNALLLGEKVAARRWFSRMAKEWPGYALIERRLRLLEELR